ncbi:MAG: spermidine synthase [Sphingomonadaceae bacterium]|nr:spermidine synthase [Sphingomonadaceae bacterium]
MPQAGQEAASAPVEIVDTAQVPGGGVLHLLRRGNDFSIRSGDDELMGSQVRHSEQALATLTCERLADKGGTLLIGGLGMGFTLGAALSVMGPSAIIHVAELVPNVVAWANGPLSHIFGDSLADPRVSIEVADVHDVIERATAKFDAILLDVDNGPDGFIRPANDRLYCNWGLRAAYAALNPAGILAVWSAYTDADFLKRLKGAGFEVEEISIPAFAYGKDVRHTIWLAVKPE